MPLILHKDFNHSVQTTRQAFLGDHAQGGRGERPGLINLADFPTLSAIRFYLCCNPTCQGLSDGAKGGFLTQYALTLTLSQGSASRA